MSDIITYNTEMYEKITYPPLNTPAPIVGNPTLVEAATAISFNSELKRRKLDGVFIITDSQLVHGTIYEKKVKLIVKFCWSCC